MFKMENDLALMILINITQILTLRMIFSIFSVAIDQYVGLYMHKSKCLPKLLLTLIFIIFLNLI